MSRAGKCLGIISSICVKAQTCTTRLCFLFNPQQDQRKSIKQSKTESQAQESKSKWSRKIYPLTLPKVITNSWLGQVRFFARRFQPRSCVKKTISLARKCFQSGILKFLLFYVSCPSSKRHLLARAYANQPALSQGACCSPGFHAIQVDSSDLVCLGAYVDPWAAHSLDSPALTWASSEHERFLRRKL